MKFIKTLRSTVYDPAFYKEAQEHSLGEPFKVLAILGAIAIGLLILTISVGLIPFISSTFPDKLEQIFPADLVVTIANGTLSINQPEPYYIPNTFEASPTTKYLVIFDTADTLQGDANANSTYVLAKKSYAIGGSGTSQERVIPFTDIHATTTVAKTDAVAFIEKVRPYILPFSIAFIAFFVVIGTIFGTVFWLVFEAIYLLIPAVILLIFWLLLRVKPTFKHAYVLSAYASIPVAILSWLVALTSYHLPAYVYTLLVLLVAVINLTRMPQDVVEPELPHQPPVDS